MGVIVVQDDQQKFRIRPGDSPVAAISSTLAQEGIRPVGGESPATAITTLLSPSHSSWIDDNWVEVDENFSERLISGDDSSEWIDTGRLL